MARTIALESALSYELEPAVWCTTTPRVRSPVKGESHEVPDDAPHWLRVMIVGFGVYVGLPSPRSAAVVVRATPSSAVSEAVEAVACSPSLPGSIVVMRTSCGAPTLLVTRAATPSALPTHSGSVPGLPPSPSSPS